MIQEEYYLAFRKYNNKMATLDLASRAIIYTGVMNGVIKFYCRFNHYMMRDSIINRLVIIDEYPMYLEIETWQHVIICEKNKDIIIEYITKLKKELMKIEPYY